jgi:hypothetical protein
MVERAQQYLLKAIEIHPAYANAYLLWEIRMFIKITMRKHWNITNLR